MFESPRSGEARNTTSSKVSGEESALDLLVVFWVAAFDREFLQFKRNDARRVVGPGSLSMSRDPVSGHAERVHGRIMFLDD